MFLNKSKILRNITWADINFHTSCLQVCKTGLQKFGLYT